MEFLPDELWLFVFAYLKKFDIIYAFANLNRRFQWIIEPYLYDIGLTKANISYRQFCHLSTTHIINQIRSLKLSATDHLELLYPYAQAFVNLNTLTILDYDDEEKQNDRLLINFLLLPHLIELSILNDKPSVELLQAIADFSTPNLTVLNFTRRQGFSVPLRDMYAKTTLPTILSPIPNVKKLTIGLICNETLHEILEIMPNLQDLTFSLSKFSLCEEENVELDVPVTLKNLQIEACCGDFECMKKFVQAFAKSQIQLLTLIIDNASYQFENYEELHSLTLDFIQLKEFSYYIHVNDKPDKRFPNIMELCDSTYSGSEIITYSFHTWPKPVSHLIEVRPPTELIQYNSYKQVITPEQLLNCKSFDVSIQHSSDKVFSEEFDSINNNYWKKIVNLERLTLRCYSKYISELSGIRTYRIINNLLARSPNINNVCFQSNNTQTITFYLKNLPFEKLSTKITNFHVDKFDSDEEDYEVSHLSKFHATFFNDLSKVLPCIERLTLSVTDEQFVINNLFSFIENLKNRFHHLTRLIFLDHCDPKTTTIAFETLKKQLNEIIRNDKNSLHYIETDIKDIGRKLNIWL